MQHMGDGKFVGESLVAQSAHAQGQMMTGIPKSLLFYHGNDLLERGGSPADFYATTAQRMNAKSGMNHLAKGPLDTSKSKYMRDEREEKVRCAAAAVPETRPQWGVWRDAHTSTHRAPPCSVLSVMHVQHNHE